MVQNTKLKNQYKTIHFNKTETCIRQTNFKAKLKLRQANSKVQLLHGNESWLILNHFLLHWMLPDYI